MWLSFVIVTTLLSLVWSVRPHRELLRKIAVVGDDEAKSQYKKDLPKILYHCQHSNATLTKHELGRALQEEDCVVARFVSYYHSLSEPFLQDGNGNSAANGGKERTLKIDTVPADSSYAVTFEDYLLKSRTFKKAYPDLRTPDYASLESISEPIHNNPWLRYMRPDDEVIKSNEALSKVLIPPIASNSYYRRLSSEVQGKIATYMEDNCMSSPCMMKISPDTVSTTTSSTNAYVCPLHAHMVIWGVHSPSSTQQLQFQVIDRRSNHYLLQPEVIFNMTSSNIGRTRRSQDTGNMISYHHYLLNDGDDVFLPSSYRLGSFSDNLTIQGPRSSNTNIVLNKKEYLVVPNNYLVSFKTTEGLSTTTNNEINAMVLCFIDASNWNDFKQEVYQYQSLSHFHELLSEDLSAATLASSSSSTSKSFDLSMNKSPAKEGMEYSVYRTRVTTGADSTTTTGSEETTTEDPAAAAANQKNSRNRKTRAKARKNDFKSWQDSIHWKTLIDSLTLPSTMKPEIKQVGMQHLTLTWNQSFIPPESDQTPFGFKIQICSLSSEHKESWDSSSHPTLMLLDDMYAVERTASGTEGNVEKYTYKFVPAKNYVSMHTSSSTSGTVVEHSGECKEQVILRNEQIFSEEQITMLVTRNIASIISTAVPTIPNSEDEDSSVNDSPSSTPSSTTAAVEEMVSMTKIDLPLSELEPNTFYQVRVSLAYGSSANTATGTTTAATPQPAAKTSTSYSLWSTLVKTRSLSPPSMPLPPSSTLFFANIDSISSSIGGDSDSIEADYVKFLKNYSSGSHGLPVALYAKSFSQTTALSLGMFYHGHVFQTLACDVYFRVPEENGGHPIIGYLVYARIVGNSHLYYTEWQSKGIYTAHNMHDTHPHITVTNLLPGVTYEFKIAAVNKLGISPLSPASNPIRTPSTNTLTKSFSIFGDRLVGAYGLVTETFLRERSLALSKSSALAMTSFAPPLPMNNVIEYTKEVVGAIEMNFEEQVIYMVQTMDHSSVGQVPSIAPVPFWRCHWSQPSATAIGYFTPLSSSSITVEGGSLLTENTQQKVEWEDSIAGKIVFIRRGGGIALYQHSLNAQAAGAIAIVIVDDPTTGKCSRGYDQRCIPGATKAFGEGFAMADIPSIWTDVKIPVAFILQEDYDQLLQNVDEARTQRNIALARNADAAEMQRRAIEAANAGRDEL